MNLVEPKCYAQGNHRVALIQSRDKRVVIERSLEIPVGIGNSLTPPFALLQSLLEQYQEEVSEVEEHHRPRVIEDVG